MCNFVLGSCTHQEHPPCSDGLLIGAPARTVRVVLDHPTVRLAMVCLVVHRFEGECWLVVREQQGKVNYDETERAKHNCITLVLLLWTSNKAS